MELAKVISKRKGLYRLSRYEYKIKKLKEFPIKLGKDEQTLFKRYKYSAKARNLTFELTTDTFRRLITSPCYYCGTIPKQKCGEILYNGIDRDDNSTGYTCRNTLTCCQVCNRAKSNMSSNDFWDWMKSLSYHRYELFKAVDNRDYFKVDELVSQLEKNNGQYIH